MRILVVFENKSHSAVSDPLVEKLKADFDVEFQVISAHRNPEMLHRTVTQWQGDAIVAGAGNAAILPGVIASLTPKPVFGIPVAAQYGGLDALVSISQTPFGAPVMTSGPDDVGGVASFLHAWKERRADHPRELNIVVNAEAAHEEYVVDEIGLAQELAAEKGFDVHLGEDVQGDGLNLVAVTDAADVMNGAFCLHAPVFHAEAASDPAACLTMFDWARSGGIWLGANNLRNAVLSAERLLG